MLSGFAILAMGATTFSTTRPIDLDRPGGLAVLNPSEWVGQPFPLLDRLTAGGQLRHGEWVILFHRRGCPACTFIQDEFANLTKKRHEFDAMPQLACVEIPSDEQSTTSNQSPWCQHLQLQTQRVWMTTTPVCIRLSSGRTMAVTFDMNEAKRWIKR
jgi:hypothetical protein